MEAVAERGIPMVVLDRPNPLGDTVQGPVLRDEERSFINHFPLPLRHGMTLGELARLFRAELGMALDLQVVAMEGWCRCAYYAETDLAWTAPSPNLPTADHTVLYPAVGLVESTNLSVGRGTPTPFQVVGAPFVD